MPFAGLLLPATVWLTLGCWAAPASEQEEPKSSNETRPGFLGQLQGHKRAIYALAISPNGLLASGDKEGVIYVWNLTCRAKVPSRPWRKLTGHRYGVTALSFTWNSMLLSGAADNTTLLWDLASGTISQQIPHPKTVFGISVDPRGEGGFDGFATAAWDGNLRVFTASGEQRALLGGHRGGLYAVAHSAFDGNLVATASADRTVKVWDVEKQTLLWTLSGHKDHVTAVGWSDKELQLASVGWDRRFRLWSLSKEEVAACRSLSKCSTDIAPRHVRRHPQLLWAVAFAPGGRLVAACHGAVGQSPTVVLYDAENGAVLRRLGRHKDTPLALAFSPTGEILASAGMDRQVLLYDAAEPADDLPQGDLDDEEERLQWLQDVQDFREERKSLNASEIALLAQKLAHLQNRSRNDQGERGSRTPHPASGVVAFL
ncbi:unnamed protein product [Symbiodinium natans]|uniref:Uncharacterized protein n=1 Tax=Symbiodinium natans TaxID=878477 RepID=A0A812PUS6_9DINO|nr:unnamed protein product [Symbiodinium natans]